MSAADAAAAGGSGAAAASGGAGGEGFDAKTVATVQKLPLLTVREAVAREGAASSFGTRPRSIQLLLP